MAPTLHRFRGLGSRYTYSTTRPEALGTRHYSGNRGLYTPNPTQRFLQGVWIHQSCRLRVLCLVHKTLLYLGRPHIRTWSQMFVSIAILQYIAKGAVTLLIRVPEYNVCSIKPAAV